MAKILVKGCIFWITCFYLYIILSSQSLRISYEVGQSYLDSDIAFNFG